MLKAPKGVFCYDLQMRKQYHFWPGINRLDAWGVDRLIRLTCDFPTETVELSDIGEIDSNY